MDSCQCQGIEARFGKKYVAKKLAKYHKNGSKKTTLQLIQALQAMGVNGKTLLDIGGGIGDIQHALLQSGVSHAIDSEASAAYIEACQQEAERLGHADRISHVLGNFVTVANDIAPADIVTLDRVICCYDDMPALVGSSAQKTKWLYGIVYPIDRRWVRLLMGVYYNLRYWAQRNPMRNFVHSSKDVEAVIRGNGLSRSFYTVIGLWQVAVYTRPPSS